jgi:hypothetical protein
MGYFRSDEQLETLVKDFEAGRLVKGEWHHAEHLAICFWYLYRTDLLAAIFRLKLGILKYNERDGVPQTIERGYHETITLFFVKLVKKYVDGIDRSHGSLIEKLNPFLEIHKSFVSTLWQYYSRPRLNSLEARIQWLEPDLRPL